MTISVIIPTLNEQKTIAGTLQYTATLGFDEIIVADGGSTDGTSVLAETCCAGIAGACTITAPQGRARQMNAGAQTSQGEVLVFLHADTYLPAEAKRLIETSLADPAVAGGRFDVRFDSPSMWGRVISRMMNLRSRLTGIATGDQALFVRRRVFEQLGGFPDIPLMEDIEFCRRLKRVGHIAAIPEAATTSFRRWEAQGPLRTILQMWTLRLLYWTGVSPHRLKDFYAVIR